MKALQTNMSHLDTLIIPQQSFGDHGFKVLCDMIQAKPAFLKKLDISWNELLEKQVVQLFNALSKNSSLEDLNLAMTSVPKGKDTKK